jgi:hypothetical protein
MAALQMNGGVFTGTYAQSVIAVSVVNRGQKDEGVAASSARWLVQRVLADVEEPSSSDENTHTITLAVEGRIVAGASERNLFRALRNLRLELEKHDILLKCFGASEDVYPSGMQEDMGSAELAYKTRLGERALTKDIVNIFDCDESVKPVTVSA